MTDYHQFCDEWLSAWTGNQPDKLIQYYSDDTFYSDPANPDGLKGRVQLLSYFEKLLAKNPAWKWQAEEIMPTEKGFTLKWKATIPVKESRLIIYGLDIVEVNVSLITRNEVYFDRTPWLELLK